MSFLSKRSSVRLGVDQNKQLLDLLDGEVLTPEYQFFNCYYFKSITKKEEVIITMTNYRMFIKSLLFAETISIPFMMIDNFKRLEGDILLITCKDVRSVSIMIGRQERQLNGSNAPKDGITLFEKRLKELTEPQRIQDSFAFHYHQTFPRSDTGWNIYNPDKYFTNLLTGYQTTDGNPVWCISTLNENYGLSPTYPASLVVPVTVSDEDTLRKVGNYRSKGRIPAMCWKHPTKPITISRCSQPKVGITLQSCHADRQLIEAVRQTNPLSQTLYFVDARPKVNAIGNVLGNQGGYEIDYRNSKVSFLNIENIHAMRTSWVSLSQLVLTSSPQWYTDLENTQWLQHIKSLLAGAQEITQIIEKLNSSVVIHCSDGWDRTAQLSSLAQLLIDPFFRSLDGFAILIEKEWCSFGHKFAQRVGHEMENKKKSRSSERSPIFIQWLDAVWQIANQFPDAFEFNEEFLIFLADALYDCRFGTFLHNNEKDRKVSQSLTVSIWSWTHLPENKIVYTNPLYTYSNEVLWPSCTTKHIKLWENYWLRWDPDYVPRFMTPLILKTIQKYKTNTPEEISEIGS